MKEKLQKIIQEALKNLGIETENISLEHPADLANGDYSTNVALVCAKSAGVSPRSLAEKILAEILKNKPQEIEKIETAGPGFINFYLSKEFFANSIKEINSNENWGKNKLSSGKKVMFEYTDPNPFKPFHIGHLMTNAIGESIARIFEYSGADVIRANYQGDVGLHVAKAMWMLLKKGKCDASLPIKQQAEYIGACYVEGSTAYENDESAKNEIDILNKKIYAKSDTEINAIYDWGRTITLEAFEEIYQTLGTKFNSNCYFFESVMAPLGEKIVRENIGNVFEESDGAIVFKAEKFDPKLHTRVFVTKQGLPTYEAKEIGLTVTKFTQENPDLSLVVTAIEQGPYMEVVQKALSIIHPDYESRMKHLTHGMMRFANGKMSSRKGNVITGESLLNDTKEMVYEKIASRDFITSEKDTLSEVVAVASIKYTILKQSLGGNIIYDQEKSISFEGDSGPYLQYSLVRAKSVLEKATKEGIVAQASLAPQDWQTTSLEKHLYRFAEIVERAYESLEPHHIATYLTELASLFNSFYANEQIIDKTNLEISAYKLAIVQAFAKTMQGGLYVLGISAPEKM